MAERLKMIPKKHKTPFVKGHKLAVGNRGFTLEARREKRFITAALEHKLNQIVKSNDPTRLKSRRVDYMVEAVLKKACKGDVFAFNAIADRVEGRPVQAVEHSGKDNEPIKMVHVGMSLSEAVKAFMETRLR